jgi:hypothetical protein
MRPWNSNNMHTVIEDYKQLGNGYRYKNQIKNLSKGTEFLTICVYYIPLLVGQEGKWIKNYIRIDRHTGWGNSYNVKTAR